MQLSGEGKESNVLHFKKSTPMIAQSIDIENDKDKGKGKGKG